MDLAGPVGRVEALPDHRVRVTVELPQKPVQIAVDPDQVLEDSDPANNYWKPRERWRSKRRPAHTIRITCDAAGLVSADLISEALATDRADLLERPVGAKAEATT